MTQRFLHIILLAAIVTAGTIFVRDKTTAGRIENQADIAPAPPLPRKSMTDHYRSVISFWAAHLKRDPYSITAAEQLASTRIALARASGDERQYQKVVALLQPIAEQHPAPTTKVKILLARALMAQHRFKEAKEIAEQILAAEPRHFNAQELQADALLGAGSYNEAFAAIDQLYKIKTNYSSLVRMADMQERIGNKSKAIVFFKQARAQFHSAALEPEAWVVLRIGILYLRAEELARAERYFREALQIAPSYYLALEHLAEVYEKRRQWSKAEPLLAKAIAEKRDANLLLRMAAIQEELDRPEQAAELTKKAEQLLRAAAYDGSDSHVREYAEYLLERGETKEAILLLEKDLRLRPGDLHSKQLMVKAKELALTR